jgi:hypothetical protein
MEQKKLFQNVNIKPADHERREKKYKLQCSATKTSKCVLRLRFLSEDRLNKTILKLSFDLNT